MLAIDDFSRSIRLRLRALCTGGIIYRKGWTGWRRREKKSGCKASNFWMRGARGFDCSPVQKLPERLLDVIWYRG